MKRRDFIKLGSVLALAVPTVSPGAARLFENKNYDSNKQVDFLYDGLQLSPKEYTDLLLKLADENKIKPDFYSNGGVVEELENKFAKLLGKESAVFMPTGTLANHIALRKLAGTSRRVVVQEQSHIYLDSGDCCQTLSGLNLIPLGATSTEFSLGDLGQIVAKTKSGRVVTKVGVISIETPVRRMRDQMVGFGNMKAITGYAKQNDIKTHLDGARLFVQSVHTNIEPARYGELFDTVYTSLYKCFNASSGAILAGSKVFTENLFHERRMFGGGLPAVWPFAAVALHYADTFLEDYKTAWQKAEKFFSLIQKDERFKVEKIPNGSHIVFLNVKSSNLMRFKESLAAKNIHFPEPDKNRFVLKINPSFNNITPEDLSAICIELLK